MGDLNDWEEIDSTGTIPPKIFGHSITIINKTKVVLFGGMFEEDGNLTMSNSLYVYNVYKKEWSLIKRKQYYNIANGYTPSPRAAHSSTAVEYLKMAVYGGAIGGIVN